jgi:hypothetical protein
MCDQFLAGSAIVLFVVNEQASALAHASGRLPAFPLIPFSLRSFEQQSVPELRQSSAWLVDHFIPFAQHRWANLVSPHCDAPPRRA